MQERLEYVALATLAHLGGEATFRKIACGVMAKRDGAFPHGLIFALYHLQKAGFVSSVLVAETMPDITGMVEQRLFRMEDLGERALREPRVLEELPELQVNSLRELIVALKGFDEGFGPDFDAGQFGDVFDEGMDCWFGRV